MMFSGTGVTARTSTMSQMRVSSLSPRRLELLHVVHNGKCQETAQGSNTEAAKEHHDFRSKVQHCHISHVRHKQLRKGNAHTPMAPLTTANIATASSTQTLTPKILAPAVQNPVPFTAICGSDMPRQKGNKKQNITGATGRVSYTRQAAQRSTHGTHVDVGIAGNEFHAFLKDDQAALNALHKASNLQRAKEGVGEDERELGTEE